MKTRLFFLSLIASLLFLSCDKDNDKPDDLPQTEAELKSAIQQKWDIGTATSAYKSITFKPDNTYNVIKKADNAVIGGEYTIEKDLRTLRLTNLGKIELTTLTSDRLKFKLTLEGADSNVDIDCSPAALTAEKVLISEIQIEVDGKYLPETQFTYKNNVLNEVLVTTYYNTVTDYFQTKYVFEVNAENKITGANRYVKPKDIKDWTLTGKYEIIYKGGNISRIKDFDLGYETYTAYDYTWEAGKIIKMKKGGEKEIEFTYTNGNYTGVENSDIEIDDEKYKDITNKVTNEFDAAQKNWFEYLPVEYTMLSDPEGLKKLIPFSDNNVSETTYSSLSNAKNKNTNKKIYTLEYNYIMTFSYSYKDGLTDSFAVISTENTKYTDFIEPSKSEENKKGPDTKKYKIKYIEIE